MVPTPVLQADAGTAGRRHHGHHWEGVMVGLVTMSSIGSIAQRPKLKAKATKATKAKVTMCAEGDAEADPLLAEAKAAAEAAKLQLEAVAWLKMNAET